MDNMDMGYFASYLVNCNTSKHLPSLFAQLLVQPSRFGRHEAFGPSYNGPNMRLNAEISGLTKLGLAAKWDSVVAGSSSSSRAKLFKPPKYRRTYTVDTNF